MLYPIELLRRKAGNERRAARTACMLTSRPAFVMSSVGLFACGLYPPGCPDRAICNEAVSHHCSLHEKADQKSTQPTDF